MTYPSTAEVNRVPSSSAEVSVSDAVAGVSPPNSRHGQVTVTARWVGVLWRLPLSSVARTWMVVAPTPPAVPV